jgi:hypothetical protein
MGALRSQEAWNAVENGLSARGIPYYFFISMGDYFYVPHPLAEAARAVFRATPGVDPNDIHPAGFGAPPLTGHKFRQAEFVWPRTR